MFFNRLKFSKLRQNSGQATVEYLLLLFVVILLGKFILTPLGAGLKNFASSFLGPGNYYSCLMENGLLPTFDTIEVDGKKFDCGSFKKDFALGSGSGDGSGSEDSSGGSSGGGYSESDSGSAEEGGSNSENSSETTADGKNSKKGSKKSAQNSKSSSRGSYAGRDSRNSQANALLPLNSKKNGKKKKGKKNAGDEGDGIGPNAAPDRFVKRKNNRATRTAKSFRSSYDDGYLGDLDLDFGEDNQRPPLVKIETSGKGQGSFSESQKKNQLKRGKIKEQPRDLAENKNTIDFSAFIKYLVIAAFLVAILLVIFSQIMEFQSRD